MGRDFHHQLLKLAINQIKWLRSSIKKARLESNWREADCSLLLQWWPVNILKTWMDLGFEFYWKSLHSQKSHPPASQLPLVFSPRFWPQNANSFSQVKMFSLILSTNTWISCSEPSRPSYANGKWGCRIFWSRYLLERQGSTKPFQQSPYPHLKYPVKCQPPFPRED